LGLLRVAFPLGRGSCDRSSSCCIYTVSNSLSWSFLYSHFVVSRYSLPFSRVSVFCFQLRSFALNRGQPPHPMSFVSIHLFCLFLFLVVHTPYFYLFKPQPPYRVLSRVVTLLPSVLSPRSCDILLMSFFIHLLQVCSKVQAAFVFVRTMNSLERPSMSQMCLIVNVLIRGSSLFLFSPPPVFFFVDLIPLGSPPLQMLIKLIFLR